MDLLAGRGDLLHATLLNMGLILSASSKAKGFLSTYISSSSGSKVSVCVDRVGWIDDCYVLPDRTIGDSNGKDIQFQTAHPDSLGFNQKGSLVEWREQVANFAVGNSRISFAISASLAAPLFSLLGMEGGGFHFRGESSKGKTIALYAAGSVWGGHDRKKMWRATTNGLEQTAYNHNDSLLLLDEMGEMNNKEIGNAVYMLANGQGKQRMTEANPKTWNLLFLSTGEVDLKSAMQEAGVVTRAGQEVRLIDIEAVTGNYGVFDVLVDKYTSSKEQAEQLKSITQDQYGTAGVCFLEKFIENKKDGKQYMEETKVDFVKEVTPSAANSQVQRVLNRFALVAAGGELATRYGITGWKEGEAYEGAKACFNSWLANLGNVEHSQEHIQGIQRVRLFIEQHGESRFRSLNFGAPLSAVVSNRAGYKKHDENGVMIYYFSPEVFKSEVCKGLSLKTVLHALKAEGVLKHESGKLQTNTPSIDDGARVKSYAVYSKILSCDQR